MNVQIKMDEVTNWILDKFKNPTCSICGENAWEFSDKLWHITEYAPQSAIVRVGGTPIGGGQSLMMVFMICMNCKQVHTFNAIAIVLQTQEDAQIKTAPPMIPPEGLSGIEH